MCESLRGQVGLLRHCEATKWPWQSLFSKTKRLLRFARNDKIRDCFVASLLAMTHPFPSFRAPGGRVAISTESVIASSPKDCVAILRDCFALTSFELAMTPLFRHCEAAVRQPWQSLFFKTRRLLRFASLAMTRYEIASSLRSSQ